MRSIVQITNGVTGIVDKVQTLLVYWEKKYKHMWDQDKDAYIRYACCALQRHHGTYLLMPCQPAMPTADNQNIHMCASICMVEAQCVHVTVMTPKLCKRIDHWCFLTIARCCVYLVHLHECLQAV